jgi:hypothetical protein
VPFYIGITRIPEIYAGGDAYHVFEALGVALEEAPEFKQAVRRHWEAFEFQTLREGSFLEKQVAELADSGSMDEAREILTGFVAEKAQKALADARVITEKINKEKLISRIP